MKTKFGIVIIALAYIVTVGVAVAADVPPPWAYGFTGPAPATPPPAATPAPAAPPDTSMKSLSGSSSQLTRAQISNR